MAGRAPRRTSTPRILAWAVIMFLLGIGLGALLSSSACRPRNKRLPGEEETVPARPAPPARRRAPAPAPGLAVPEPAAPGPAAPVPVQPAPPAAKPPATPPVVPAPSPARPAPKGEGLPRLALVIDDLGYAAPDLVGRLCALPIPFDVSVLPFQEFTRASAQIAHDQGKEVMLHLPMEPLGYPGPGKNPGPGAVLVAQSEAEVRERVRQALAAVPHRVGVNNHMGSRVTPDRVRMTWVLEEIRASRCFFVDSRTEKDSVAFAVARELGVPTAQRKVFLDDDKDYAAIAHQWDRALALARSDGQVLVIGHIYPETVAALEKLLPPAIGQIMFVKASALATR